MGGVGILLHRWMSCKNWRKLPFRVVLRILKFVDLIEAYRQLRSCDSDSFFPRGMPEKIAPIYENDQIRILLLRTIDEPEKIRVEVEVTMPEQLQEFNAMLLSDELDSSDQAGLSNALEVTILLFQYMLRLQKIGFYLGFFSEENVWNASYVLETRPTKGFFSRLQPPRIRRKAVRTK
jgi:hypothetical protein